MKLYRITQLREVLVNYLYARNLCSHAHSAKTKQPQSQASATLGYLVYKSTISTQDTSSVNPECSILELEMMDSTKSHYIYEQFYRYFVVSYFQQAC